MGLAELFLGKENPFSQYVADNKQTVRGAFAGFGQGSNFGAGLGNAAIGAQRGSVADDFASQQKAEEAKRQETLNQTIEYMRSKGYDDLIAGVESGGMDMGAAWTEALRRGQPQAAKPPIEVGGVLVDPVTFQPIFDSRQPEKPPAAPSGYQWNPDGSQSYVPGGPADPAFATPKPPTDAERRGAALTSVVDSDAALLLGDGTNPGVFEQLADSGDQFWNAGVMGVNPLKGVSSPEYQKATNAVENIAQSYLYAISGQAAPAAEVEKIVNSITPRPFENPAVLVEKKRRLGEYVDAIRMSAGNHSSVAGGNSGDGWEVVGVQ